MIRVLYLERVGLEKICVFVYFLGSGFLGLRLQRVSFVVEESRGSRVFWFFVNLLVVRVSVIGQLVVDFSLFMRV